MKINYLLCVLIFLIIWGCTETELRQMDFKGDFGIKVSAYDEFGQSINDKSNFKVTLEGLNPALEINTDENGLAEFKNIPLGTYCLIIQKEGYDTLRYPGVKFLAGENNGFQVFSFYKKSTTRINTFKIEYSTPFSVVSGTISHNYPKTLPGYTSTYPYGLPAVMIFISNKTDVSPTNYVYSTYCYASQQNDTTFSGNLYFVQMQFPTGTTMLYAVMYGRNRITISYYDAEKFRYHILGLGDPSEVKSFLLPYNWN